MGIEHITLHPMIITQNYKIITLTQKGGPVRPPNHVRPQMTHENTSEDDKSAHVAEHVARGNGAEGPEVGHRQAGGLAELEHPQKQHDHGAHSQLGRTDAPGEGDHPESELVGSLKRGWNAG